MHFLSTVFRSLLAYTALATPAEEPKSASQTLALAPPGVGPITDCTFFGGDMYSLRGFYWNKTEQEVKGAVARAGKIAHWSWSAPRYYTKFDGSVKEGFYALFFMPCDDKHKLEHELTELLHQDGIEIRCLDLFEGLDDPPPRGHDYPDRVYSDCVSPDPVRDFPVRSPGIPTYAKEWGHAFASDCSTHHGVRAGYSRVKPFEVSLLVMPWRWIL